MTDEQKRLLEAGLQTLEAGLLTVDAALAEFDQNRAVYEAERTRLLELIAAMKQKLGVSVVLQ